MAQYIEDVLPPIQSAGLNTNKAATFGSTVSTAGALTATGGVAGAMAATTLTSSGTTTITYPRLLGAVTDYDAQAATLTVAGIAGGTVTQNSKTGASTLTTPTGAEISTSVGGSVVGTTLEVLYHNRGNQTSTITAGASGVTLAGATVAIATLKTAILRFVCTGANAWTCYVVAAA